MSSQWVFPEPEEPSTGPFDGLSSWLRSAGAPEAVGARGLINAWYSTFTDRSSMVLSRLRGEDEIGLLQALDELYAHDLFSRNCLARYEEDEGSPDFRLYRGGEYVAGVELMTLFMEKGFASEISRNSSFVKEINRRVRPNKWYVTPEVVAWNRQPSLNDLARWLQSEIDALPDPPPEMTPGYFPKAQYSTPAVELVFTFVPRRRAEPPTDSEPIVAAGPSVGGFVASDRRLRSAVSSKAGEGTSTATSLLLSWLAYETLFVTLRMSLMPCTEMMQSLSTWQTPMR